MGRTWWKWGGFYEQGVQYVQCRMRKEVNGRCEILGLR